VKVSAYLCVTAVACLAATSVAAAPGPGNTMQLGLRLGPYRIGMHRVRYSELIRTIRHPENDGGGCSGAFPLDSYVDVYPGLRLGYIFGSDKKTHLDVISTSRSGDRTSLGYAIGTSTLRDVRHRYPHLKLWLHRGGSTLTVVLRTGYESGMDLTYSFDARQRLVGLATSVGGC
jgi:hypothetical protein